MRAESTILPVDMDAFFASVELRRRPELRGRPMIVAGGERGVVLSATYEARAYGVHSAMPMARALRRCPTAVVVPPDQAAYRAASVEIMKIFRDVTPLVAPLSVDEAFLDVTGARALFGPAPRIAADIRRRVAAEQNLTCSVGVAPSMFVAKIASTRCKPDGLAVIAPDEVLAFLHPLPTGALWGVGPRAEATLTRLGLRTIGDIADTPVDTLCRALGDAAGPHLHRLSWGIDEQTGGSRQHGGHHRRRTDLRHRRHRAGCARPGAAAPVRTGGRSAAAAAPARPDDLGQGALRRLPDRYSCPYAT